MDDPKPVRAFVALDLPGELKRRVGALVEDLRDTVRDARWSRPETLHVTLRFMGNARADQLEAVAAAVATAAAACAPAGCGVGPLGLFPERGRPRVLWLGLRLPDDVIALQAACEEAAVAAGFPAEGRPFSPHLTLARWAHPGVRPALPPAALGPVVLDHATLYRSELRPTGAVHTPMRVFPFTAR